MLPVLVSVLVRVFTNNIILNVPAPPATVGDVVSVPLLLVTVKVNSEPPDIQPG